MQVQMERGTGHHCAIAGSAVCLADENGPSAVKHMVTLCDLTRQKQPVCYGSNLGCECLVHLTLCVTLRVNYNNAPETPQRRAQCIQQRSRQSQQLKHYRIALDSEPSNAGIHDQLGDDLDIIPYPRPLKRREHLPVLLLVLPTFIP